jgi:hypothetical protein
MGNASRTGVRETPSLAASSTSLTRFPGGSSPCRIISRILKITREFLPAICMQIGRARNPCRNPCTFYYPSFRFPGRKLKKNAYNIMQTARKPPLKIERAESRPELTGHSRSTAKLFWGWNWPIASAEIGWVLMAIGTRSRSRSGLTVYIAFIKNAIISEGVCYLCRMKCSHAV